MMLGMDTRIPGYPAGICNQDESYASWLLSLEPFPARILHVKQAVGWSDFTWWRFLKYFDFRRREIWPSRTCHAKTTQECDPQVTESLQRKHLTSLNFGGKYPSFGGKYDPAEKEVSCKLLCAETELCTASAGLVAHAPGKQQEQIRTNLKMLSTCVCFLDLPDSPFTWCPLDISAYEYSSL